MSKIELRDLLTLATIDYSKLGYESRYIDMWIDQ